MLEILLYFYLITHRLIFIVKWDGVTIT